MFIVSRVWRREWVDEIRGVFSTLSIPRYSFFRGQTNLLDDHYAIFHKKLWRSLYIGVTAKGNNCNGSARKRPLSFPRHFSSPVTSSPRSGVARGVTLVHFWRRLKDARKEQKGSYSSSPSPLSLLLAVSPHSLLLCVRCSSIWLMGPFSG